MRMSGQAENGAGDAKDRIESDGGCQNWKEAKVLFGPPAIPCDN